MGEQSSKGNAPNTFQNKSSPLSEKKEKKSTPLSNGSFAQKGFLSPSSLSPAEAVHLLRNPALYQSYNAHLLQRTILTLQRSYGNQYTQTLLKQWTPQHSSPSSLHRQTPPPNPSPEDLEAMEKEGASLPKETEKKQKKKNEKKKKSDQKDQKGKPGGSSGNSGNNGSESEGSESGDNSSPSGGADNQKGASGKNTKPNNAKKAGASGGDQPKTKAKVTLKRAKPSPKVTLKRAKPSPAASRIQPLPLLARKESATPHDAPQKDSTSPQSDQKNQNADAENTTTIRLPSILGGGQISLAQGEMSYSLKRKISLANGRIVLRNPNLTIRQEKNAYAFEGEATLEVDAGIASGRASRASFHVNSRGDDLSGSISTLSLYLFGKKLTLKKVEFDKNQLSTKQASLQLPNFIGGGEATVGTFKINQDGFQPPSTIRLNQEKIVVSNAFSISNPRLSFRLLKEGFKIEGAGTVSMDFPHIQAKSTQSLKVAYYSADDKISGTIKELQITLLERRIQMDNVKFDNAELKGLSAEKATMTLPKSLGEASVSLNNVSITSAGFQCGGVTLAGVNIVVQNILSLNLSEGTFTFLEGGHYSFSAQGQLSLQNLSNVEGSGSFHITYNSAEDKVDGTISTAELKALGQKVELTNATFDNYDKKGIQTEKAALTLPESLGSPKLTLNQVKITQEEGFSCESVTAENIKLKVAEVLSIQVDKATVEVSKTKFTISEATGTLSVNLPQVQVSTSQLVFSYDSSNNHVKGKVESASVSAYGQTFVIQGASFDNYSQKGLKAKTATMTLPQMLGGGKVTVKHLSITQKEGFHFSSAELKGLQINVAQVLQLKLSKAKLKWLEQGFQLSGSASASIHTNGVSGKATNASFEYDTTNQQLKGKITSLSLQAFKQKITLKNAAFDNFEKKGVWVEKATMTLPDLLGGGKATLTNVSLTQEKGFYFEQLDLTGLEIRIANAVKISKLNAKVQWLKDGFSLSGTGNLSVIVPNVNGSAENISFSYNTTNDQFSGSFQNLELNLFGKTIQLTTVTFDNYQLNGISAASGSMELPALLGGGKATLTNAKLTANEGFSCESIQFDNTKIQIAQILTVDVSSSNITFEKGQFKINATASLQLNAGSIQGSASEATFGYDSSNNQIQGSAKSLVVNAFQTTITLTNAQFDNFNRNGVYVETASMALPALLGGGSITLNQVSIGQNGFQCSGVDLKGQTIKLGSVLLIESQQLSIEFPEENKYTIKGSGKITLATSFAKGSATLTSFEFNSEGKVLGTVAKADLSLGTSQLHLESAELRDLGEVKELFIGAASVDLPELLGGKQAGSIGVQNLWIRSNGEFGLGGAFTTLKDIHIGSLATFPTLTVSISKDEQGLLFGLKGSLKLNTKNLNIEPVEFDATINPSQGILTLKSLALKTELGTFKLQNASISKEGFSAQKGEIELNVNKGVEKAAQLLGAGDLLETVSKKLPIKLKASLLVEVFGISITKDLNFSVESHKVHLPKITGLSFNLFGQTVDIDLAKGLDATIPFPTIHIPKEPIDISTKITFPLLFGLAGAYVQPRLRASLSLGGSVGVGIHRAQGGEGGTPKWNYNLNLNLFAQGNLSGRLELGAYLGVKYLNVSAGGFVQVAIKPRIDLVGKAQNISFDTAKGTWDGELTLGLKATSPVEGSVGLTVGYEIWKWDGSWDWPFGTWELANFLYEIEGKAKAGGGGMRKTKEVGPEFKINKRLFSQIEQRLKKSIEDMVPGWLSWILPW
ncbi:MAG: hypothetical protein D6805_07880 [Planctomycetota bacterium]|nr:MAG: hypothetical protein D6805_07880 [Planctomycetota bacterium]